MQSEEKEGSQVVLCVVKNAQGKRPKACRLKENLLRGDVMIIARLSRRRRGKVPSVHTVSYKSFQSSTRVSDSRENIK